MKFDTPVVRQTHFRALRDPLPTTSNGNTRADAMRIAKASYCFSTESGLVFPDGYQGKPSLKLGNMAEANGVPLIGAHDGVNDTRALMRLCKVIYEKDRKTWDHMMGLTTAQGVDSFLSENLLFMWTTPDATTYYTSAFCYVAHKGQGGVNSSSTNLQKSSNEILIANLAVDPETWRHRSDRELLLLLKGRDPDNPAEWLPAKDQPFKIIKRNDQPVMWPYMEDPCPIPGDTSNNYTQRERDVSRRRDGRLNALSREDLEARRQSILNDKALCDRLSVLADIMWKIWDPEKNAWVERDTGPKLLEDRIYDGIGLNMPQAENGKLRMYRNWFHTAPWDQREEVAVRIGELFPKPDAALKASDPIQYDQQMAWRDYAVSIKRLGLIVLYEQELVHECPGAYLKDPAHRKWVEGYIYHRLTEPAVDSKGKPLKKPKYRTIDDAERLANDDLASYHNQIEAKRNKNELTPDLAEEYARRIAMTEECLEYYKELRANLKHPAADPAPASVPAAVPTPVIHSLQQYHMPDDHAPLPLPAPAPAPAVAFEKTKKPRAKKAAAKKKPAERKPVQKELFPKRRKPSEAFAATGTRGPTQAINTQGKRKKPLVKTAPDAARSKAKANPPPPPRKGRGGRTPN